MKTFKQYEILLKKRLPKNNKVNLNLFYYIFYPNLLDNLIDVNWDDVGTYLSRYNPNYLEEWQHKIKEWSYVGCHLAEHNPDYLEKWEHNIARNFFSG